MSRLAIPLTVLLFVLLMASPAASLMTAAAGDDGGSRSSSSLGAYVTVDISPEPVVFRTAGTAEVMLTFEEYNNVGARIPSVDLTFLTVRGVMLSSAPMHRTLPAIVGGSSNTSVRTSLVIPQAVVEKATLLGHHRLCMDMRFQVEDETGREFSHVRRVTVELEQRVALLVDEAVHPYISERLARYESDVNSRMPVDFLEVTGSWSTPEAVRGELTRLWRDEGISGAILVGHPPFAMWEFDRGEDGIEYCPIPIFYEDLDGDFGDTDNDGYYDHHYWGENDGPEIWVSFMMPPRRTIPSTNLDPQGSGNGGGLLGQYYSYRNFNNYLLTRTDPVVDFYWERDAPSVFRTPELFSILWTGRIGAEVEEDYTIAPFCGGGIKMWLDGELVLDQPDGAPWNWREYTIDVHLTEGWHAVRIEYNENGWGLNYNGALRLAWSSPSILGANLNDYLDKSHAYYAGELGQPERGLLFFDYAYGVECKMQSPIQQMLMDPLYGEQLLANEVDTTTCASDYLEYLDMGAELVSVWSHAGSGNHWMPPKEEVPDNISSAATWLVRECEGGMVTLIWGCHAGDFGTTPEGVSKLSENLAVNYAHSGKYGLASMACTRSFGTTFRETYFALQNRSCLAAGYFAFKDFCYDEVQRQRVYKDVALDRWIDDEVLLGDPFITVDHYPTRLSVSIDGGAKHTDSATVNLTIAAEGATEVRLRNEGGPWTGWMPYRETLEWELSAGYGGTGVYLETRNAYGQALEPASDAISRVASTLDVERVTLAGGDEFTSDQEVDLAIEMRGGNPELVEMRARNEEEPWGAWVALESPVRWTLSHGNGAKTVRVQLRELSGIRTVEVQDTVVLDTISPRTFAEVEGVDGMDGWYTSAVRVTLTATDALDATPVTRYRLDGADWAVYGAPIEISEEGRHVLELLSTDLAGNEEAATTLPLNIDTRPPELLSLVLSDGALITNSAQVAVTVAAHDGASGVGAMAFREVGSPWGTWEAFRGSSTWSFLALDAERTLEVRVRDAAGNEAPASLSASIVVDVTPPTVVGMVPQMEGTGVPVNGSVSVTFSEPIDPSTLEDGGLIVSMADGTVVGGELAYDASLTTVTFVPSAQLEAMATHTVTISRDVHDRAGNVLMGGRGSTWSFTTEGAPPSSPEGLSAEEQDGSVRLAWEPPEDEGSGSVTLYYVYRGSVVHDGAQGRALVAKVMSTHYVDRTVRRNATYAYLVVACNAYGEGPPSSSACVHIPAELPPLPPSAETAVDDDQEVQDDGPSDLRTQGGESFATVSLIISVLAVATVSAMVALRKRRR